MTIKKQTSGPRAHDRTGKRSAGFLQSQSLLQRNRSSSKLRHQRALANGELETSV